MDPKVVIESYVDEVALRLPARLRKDVGVELRELLYEELGNRAAGGKPDEAMAHALLKSFGAPADVAARYQPAAATIIPAREARIFTWIGIGGVLAQWALSLPIEVIAPAHDTLWVRLGQWAAGSGLHAFAFPGAMAACLAAWLWLQHRRGDADTVTLKIFADLPPLPALDPQRVNRWAWGAALIGFAIGMPLYAIAPSLIGDPAPAGAEAFALDQDFARHRWPWLLAVWGLQLAVFLAVLVDGRWRKATRIADFALQIAGAGMLIWFAFGGRMFQSDVTNGYAQLIVAGVALLIVAVTGIKFWREQARVGTARPRTS